MVLLLVVRARSASILLDSLVFQAPAQDGLLGPIPALPPIRALHRFPMYVPMTFHRLLRASDPGRRICPSIGVPISLALRGAWAARVAEQELRLAAHAENLSFAISHL